MKKKILSLILMMSLAASLAACGQDSGKNSNSTDLLKTETEASSGQTGEEETTLVYGSADYTRINPAMDEHGEINLLLFNGLTAHDADDNIVPGLAEKWEYDAETCTYTFHIRDGIQWHDGEKFTADDVKFTIEAIMDPENGSENAPNYEDVEEITVIDDSTVSFRLSEPNVAFLEYMTMAILPKHLLEGENMQESDFFRAPVGTGPYKLESWDEGQSIVLVKNEDYYLGAPKIDKVIFKIVPDDNAQAMQLESGELDLALLDPKNAQNFKEKDGFTCYDMTTADYRGILFNFANDYWTKNRDIIPAVCYSIDRQAIIDSVLLGEGMAAYSPLQRNIYNNENVEHYDYNPEKAQEILDGLERKGYAEEDFLGNLEVEPACTEMLQPVYQGMYESELILREESGASVHYKFHHMENRITSVECRAQEYRVRAQDKKEIEKMLYSLLEEDVHTEEREAYIAIDQAERSIILKGTHIGKDTCLYFYAEKGGSFYEIAPEQKEETILRLVEKNVVCEQAKKILMGD